MEGQLESAGDVLTGTLAAAAVEGDAGRAGARDANAAAGECRNCGATLGGRYCAQCGQPAHLHRSLLALGHEILHGVFHFEGKTWRTIPELFFHPGRLTRRYIDGERAKFVSPMALFLFTVFLTFAAFSFGGGGQSGSDEPALSLTSPLTRSMAATDEQLATLRERLAEPELSPERRARLERKIADLEESRRSLELLSKGQLMEIAALGEQRAAARGAQHAADAPGADRSESPSPTPDASALRAGARSIKSVNANFGWPALERRVEDGIRRANDNPSLALYKLKSNAYKFSWLLIPLSVPFMWLLFFWRGLRGEIRLYDHAIFVTYSISFMMLLAVLLSLAAASGASEAIWGSALAFAPPLHLYKQLRGAYGLSRFGAIVRLFALLIAITFVLVIFFLILLLFGVFG